ncbi:glutaredoxin [Desulfonema ishimotonii]|uniref:Glutaredoxin n=1 Tax=Desulfonema ishimotonii TaxID=45657 RepID=A0A401G0J8_9BACT|nr:UXX-star (seleno)protein family 1 [Desulfonema ishimotonii]GBC62727.1 glutaredoxin [Desulfonema ishimotonii]
MEKPVIIYGKERCPYTRKARAAWPNHKYIDVIEDQSKIEEMLRLSGGQRKIPVIVEGDRITVGYGGGA